MSHPEQRLSELIAAGADRLPNPGSGGTLARWQMLAAVAAEDLALVKLFEGHTDALAILAELDGPSPDAGSTWATWAAEPPSARLHLHRDQSAGSGSAITLSGRKAWCSGADLVSHALVTAWDDDGQPCLAAVTMSQPGVTVTTDGWHAVGMGPVASGDVLFTDATAVEVGKPGDYLNRPGFWQGGGGIAACWYGGATMLANAVIDKARNSDDPHLLAHLGVIDVALTSTASLLREAATWIDARPQQNAQEWALRVRASAEQCAQIVLEHSGRALGAGPLCRDEAVARHFADLPVFIRQSHAERDLAALARLLNGDRFAPSRWSL